MGRLAKKLAGELQPGQKAFKHGGYATAPGHTRGKEQLASVHGSHGHGDMHELTPHDGAGHVRQKDAVKTFKNGGQVGSHDTGKGRTKPEAASAVKTFKKGGDTKVMAKKEIAVFKKEGREDLVKHEKDENNMKRGGKC